MSSLGDEVGIDSIQSSISAFSTDLKRTPLSLFRDFGAGKSLQLVSQAAELKFGSKFEPLSVIWQLLPKPVPEDNLRF